MKRKINIGAFLLLFVLLFTGCTTIQTQKTEVKPLGIMSAMDVELEYLLSQADISKTVSIGGNDYHIGKLEGQDVVLVKAGVGKSLSAACTAILINNFDVSSIVFTGIAGGVADNINITDVVISTDVMFHDYGYLSNEGYVELGTDFVSKVDIKADDKLEKEAYKAAVEVIGKDKVFEGTIATGDQFVANEKYVKYLSSLNVLAVEMEGASVGYVASKYDVPFVIIRSMSDKADGLAHEAYDNWYGIVSDNSGKIVMQFLKNRN